MVFIYSKIENINIKKKIFKIKVKNFYFYFYIKFNQIFFF